MKDRRARTVGELARAFVDMRTMHTSTAHTTVEKYNDVTIVHYKLYNTAIAVLVSIERDGSLMPPTAGFQTGGYRTNTTRNHLNEIVRALNDKFLRECGVAPFRRISISRKGDPDSFDLMHIVMPEYKEFIQSLYGANSETQAEPDNRPEGSPASQAAGAPAHRARTGGGARPQGGDRGQAAHVPG